MRLFSKKQTPTRKVNIFQSKGKWYFRVLADNGEIIAASEGYNKKADMLDTLDRYFAEWLVIEESMDSVRVIPKP